MVLSLLLRRILSSVINRMLECAELLSGLVLGKYVATDVSRGQIHGFQVRM